MIANYFKVGPTDEQTYYDNCLASEGGSAYCDIINYAYTLGLKSQEYLEHMTIDQLKKEIYLGHPVMVALQWGSEEECLAGEAGHFIVAIGYDENLLYFADPLMPAEYIKMTYDEFLKYWHDWDNYVWRERSGVSFHKENQ